MNFKTIKRNFDKGLQLKQIIKMAIRKDAVTR